MLDKISAEIKKIIQQFPAEDALLFQNKVFPIEKQQFFPILPSGDEKTIAFVDGGQAEIISAGNFCLNFIRVAAQLFKGKIKTELLKNEFYLFTHAVWRNNDLCYESKIFPFQEKNIDETDLFISSSNAAIRTGVERASISRVASVARRFAELALAARVQADFIVLDGTLEKTYPGEEKYLQKLSSSTSALAKSSSLFTMSGNSPVVFLRKKEIPGCWSYLITETTSFVKLHQQAKHIFRFEGNKEVLPFLTENSKDSLFLGYPYGLVYVDKMARVSNEEKKALTARFIYDKNNAGVLEYLNTMNAHDILDRMG